MGVPAGAGGTVLRRGPAPFQHVPGDTTVTIQAGKIVVDIGWSCTLFGASRVDNGQPHLVALVYAKNQLQLFLDGAVDASISQALSVQTGDGWLAAFGDELPTG